MDTSGLLSNPPGWLALAALGAACLSGIVAVIAVALALRLRSAIAKTSAALSAVDQKADDLQESLVHKIDLAQLSLTQSVEELKALLQARIEQAASDLGALRTEVDAVPGRLDQIRTDLDAVRAERGDISRLAEEARRDVAGVVDRFARFEEYFRTVFEKQLSSSAQAFDETVKDVLGRMREELERGVARIDQMQAMVESRTVAAEKMLDGQDGLQKLLREGSGKDAPAEP